jgi:hypothetical protein
VCTPVHIWAVTKIPVLYIYFLRLISFENERKKERKKKANFGVERNVQKDRKKRKSEGKKGTRLYDLPKSCVLIHRKADRPHKKKRK